MTESPLLFADADAAFAKKINEDPLSARNPPIFARTSPEAQSILKEDSRKFRAIFVNTALSNPLGIMIIRFAHHFRPGVPIFVLIDPDSKDEAGFSPEVQKNLGIRKILKKPISLSAILDLLKDDVPAEPKHAEAPEPASRHDVRTDDSAFFQSPIENFLSGRDSLFDLYIRLSENRYVKIGRAGEVMDKDRILNYMQKGVRELSMRKEDQLHFLEFCDRLTADILRNPNTWTSAKTSFTLRQGNEVARYLQDSGISDEAVAHCRGYVENVRELVTKLGLHKMDQVKTLMNEVSLYEHGVAVSMIAALLARELGIENQRSVQIVGLASLLHDIGLRSLPPQFHAEDPSVLNEEERDLFLRHPIWGAEATKSLPNVEPVVSQIIAQHHERHSHKGYPNGVGGASMLHMAEIVGISDEFVRLIERSKKDPSIQPLEEIEKVFRHFTAQIVKAFRAVFFLEITHAPVSGLGELIQSKISRK